MTAALLNPGDPGYLAAIPSWEQDCLPTAADGTVTAPAVVDVAVAVALADHEAKGHVGRLLIELAADRLGRATA